MPALPTAGSSGLVARTIAAIAGGLVVVVLAWSGPVAARDVREVPAGCPAAVGPWSAWFGLAAQESGGRGGVHCWYSDPSDAVSTLLNLARRGTRVDVVLATREGLHLVLEPAAPAT